MGEKPTYEELEAKVKNLESKLEEFKNKLSEYAPGMSDDYIRLADRFQEVIYRYDNPSSRFLFFNRIGAEQYGLDTKKSVLLLIHPDDRERVRKASKDSLSPGCDSWEIEYRFCLPDGSIRWMHDRWIVIRENSGHPIAIEGIIRDNTDRKLAEEALRESKERYQMLVETMNEGMSIEDENGLLTYVNDKFCKMLGHTKDELMGNPISNFCESADRSMFKKQLIRKKRGDRVNYEITCVKTDGRKIAAIVSPQPIFDNDGNFKGSFSVVTNISTQKEVERKLKERELELEIKTHNLEDLNSALRVLLKRREEDKIELEQNVISNVNELIAPYLKKLKESKLNERQQALLSIIESNIKEIVSPFLSRVSLSMINLTPTETQVANFVKHGKTTKEIADLLSLSPRTIESHRENIRKKLGINNKKSNLRTRLLSFQENRSNTDLLSVF